MRFKAILYIIPGILLSLILTGILSCQTETEPEWPEINSQNKPWTRWWWMGSAVSEAGLSNALEEYAKVGLGGVEITPIYGVKAYEEDYIEYLSREWVQMLIHTLEESKRLGMEVDMATGTGWPFGGPWVSSDDACKYMAYRIYELSTGEQLNEAVKYVQKPFNRTIGRKVDLAELSRPVSSNSDLQQIAFEQIRFREELPLVLCMAYNEEGKTENLTDKVNEEGILEWIAPSGDWKVYAVFQGLHGKLVERAAPGGEGDIIDHFSEGALLHYLHKFDRAFEGKDITALRGFFNDSYEVDDAWGEADFTPELFEEFQKRRGYDLRNYLPALFGQDTLNPIHSRILADYRETLSELLLENFTEPWKEWANARGAIVRNQAHGSPANILDLYATVDVPETEGEDLLKIKFASSAGNVTGKQLISCEAATWLDEHFQSTLAQAKKNADRYFLGGVNHLVYHGTTYSPAEAPWPGWMFYASVHFAPTNTFWDDFSALNHYVARCQSFLQSGKPDNDILLYFPFHDRIADRGSSLLQHFSGSGPGDKQTNFRVLAEQLIEKGFTLDYISDKQILETNFQGNRLHTTGGTYQTIVVPACQFIPLKTISKLVELAQAGAYIIFHQKLPQDISGYADRAEQQKAFKELQSELKFDSSERAGISWAGYGNGTVLLGDSITGLLEAAGIFPEEMVDQGIRFCRRKNDRGRSYFIENNNYQVFADYVPVNISTDNIALFNPATEQMGLAHTRRSEAGTTEIYIQLEPGETCILQTYDQKIAGERYPYYKTLEQGLTLNTGWKISFIKGGPNLPQNQFVESTMFWTDFKGDDYESFSGTAIYTTRFTIPDKDHPAWLLDLGRLTESATVYLNGKRLATLISPPYKTIIPSELLPESNQLEVHVSNLMVNRIIYMERKGIKYKNFYNVNFPARTAACRGSDGLFTTGNREPQPSGLQGPVTLTGVKQKEF